MISNVIRYCYDDEECEQILHNMGEQQIPRLPVVDRNKRLVGVISITDLAALNPALLHQSIARLWWAMALKGAAAIIAGTRLPLHHGRWWMIASGSTRIGLALRLRLHSLSQPL